MNYTEPLRSAPRGDKSPHRSNAATGEPTSGMFQETARMFDLIMDAIPSRVFWKDVNLNYLGCNGKFAKDAGLASPEEIIGKSDFELSWKELAESYRADDRRVIETGLPMLNCEERKITPEGDLWARTSKFPLHGKYGNTIGILGAYQTISNRKRVEREAEEEIRIQRERFKLLTENSPFGMLLIGKGVTFNYVNPKFKEIFGYDLQDLPNGKEWFLKAYPDGVYGKDVLSAWIGNLQTPGSEKARPRIFTVTCKDGTEKIIKFIPVLLENGDNLMTCEDITDRKRSENLLRKQREQLQDLSAKLSEAEETERKRISRELHDQVGQNLATLGLNLNILLTMIPAASADAVRSRLEDSLNLVQQTTQYTRDLMAELRPPVMDDYGLMASIRWYGERFSRRTGVEFTFKGEDLLPRPKPLMEVTLFRIFQEALNNVTKHARAQRVDFLGEIADGRLKLLISDDGIGFDLNKISKTREQCGWGLTTMAERAESIGGKFSIETKSGRGTKITVEVSLWALPSS
jgi:PAS domain S-box-containing protein